MRVDSARSEDALLAEDVAPPGDVLPRHRRDHLVDDEIDVFRAPVPVFGRHFMGPHEGGDHRDGVPAADVRNHAQQLQLGRGGQAVAALDLAGGRAVRQHLVETRNRRGSQRRFGALRVSPQRSRRCRRRLPRFARTRPRRAAGAARRGDRRRKRRGYGRRRTPVRRCAAPAGRRRLARPACRRGRSAVGPAKTMEPCSEATAPSSIAPASACAAPRRGAGPAHVSS